MGADTNEEKVRHRVLSSIPRFLSIFLAAAGLLVVIVYLFSIGISLWGEHVVGMGYFYLILAFFLPQVFLHFPMRAGASDHIPWYDGVLAFVAFFAPFYFFTKGQQIIDFGWEFSPPSFAFILGIVLWAIVLEAARRAVGWVLFFMILLFSLYPLVAMYMPGPLFAKNFSFYRLVGYYVMGPEGITGVPTRVLGNLFVGFMLFGVVLTVTGAAKFFLDLALSMLGSVRGGTAKVSVMSSAMMGSLSGSVITNVITTGSFTIPAMKKTGYPAYYAGAIETCASSGGVLMPPIMGAAAFLMASLLNISYGAVVLAAIVPSILYYVGLFVQVDGYAAKHELMGLEKEQIPSLKQSFKEGWPYLFAFAVLLYVLFGLRREAQAPFYGAAAVLIISFLKKSSRLDAKGFILLLERVGKVIGEITGTLAGIGILIGSLLITGVAQTLSSELIGLAHGNTVLLVMMGAVASFILGMGLTVTACYILLAVLLAPAMVNAGLNEIAVHIFIIYCGALSFITPPVAIGAYAAAAIANANPMRTAMQAVRLGAVKYCIPFFIVLSPALILQGSFADVFWAVVTGMLGVIFLASGIEGYLIFIGDLGVFSRPLSILGGFLLFIPESWTNIIGAALISIMFLRKYIMKSRAGRRERAVENGDTPTS